MIVIWNNGRVPIPVAHIRGFDYKRNAQIKREALKEVSNYRMKQLRKGRKPKRMRKE